MKNEYALKTFNNLLELKIDKDMTRSLIKKYGYKEVNAYIKYLNWKLYK